MHVDAQRSVGERRKRRATPRIFLGVLRFEPAGNRLHGGLRLAQAHSGFEPPKTGEIEESSVLEIRLNKTLKDPRVHADGKPNLVRAGEQQCPLELRRRDPDDRVVVSVETHRPAEHIALPSKFARPKAVADHGHRIAARMLVFLRPKCPAQQSAHTQHLEIVGGN